MSGTIAFDPWLPAELDGRLALCASLSGRTMVIDLPDSVAVVGRVRLRLYGNRHARLDVTAEVRSVDPVGPAGGPRVVLEAVDDGAEARITAVLSSLRKGAHLSIARNEDVESGGRRAGFELLHLPHEPLPERDADSLDLGGSLFGRPVRAPIVVAGMTGGTPRAGHINRRLAAVAQRHGLAMGLGSQRAMWENASLAESYQVRDLAPDVPIFANVGAVQLGRGLKPSDVATLIEAVDADALAVHLNVLQELVQPEGDRDWTGLWRRIETLVEHVRVPVFLKETGCGLPAHVARRAIGLGIAGFDVGGLGGTHWGWIEGFRSADPVRKEIAATFREWGLPTVDSIRAVRGAVGDGPTVLATGGLRSGLDAAKAIALGADAAGYALPFFRAADEGEEAADRLARRLIEELRIATFCSGASCARDLRTIGLREEKRP